MGIQRKKRASGKTFYYARLWFGGKEHVEGGFATHAAAEKALGALRKRLENLKIGEPEALPRYDPTLGDLLGNPDADSPGEGSYLGWMARPGAQRESYVVALRTCVRALLTFWKDRRPSDVNGDTLAEYQQHRQGMPSRMGAYWREKSEAMRIESGQPAKRGKRKKSGKDLPRIGPATINKETTVLRGALTWAASADRDPKRRIAPMVWPKRIALDVEEKRGPVLRAEDETRLLRECSPEWLRDLVILLRSTGMRAGEALALTWVKVNLDLGVVVIERTKTHRNRAVPLREEAVAMLRRRKADATDPSDGGRVFTRSTGAPIDSAHAAGKFLLVARRLGLQNEDGTRPSLHSLRHTVATKALRAGYTDAEVAMLLGHSRISDVTKKYLHTNLDRMRNMVDAAAPGSHAKLTLVHEKDEAAG